MVELLVIERHRGGATKGLGRWVFAFPPRAGDIVQIPSAGPSLEFYSVIAVEHGPVAPEGQRPFSARQVPTVTLLVEWSHDED